MPFTDATLREKATMEFIEAMAREAAGGDVGKTLGILVGTMLAFASKHDIDPGVMVAATADAWSQVKATTPARQA